MVYIYVYMDFNVLDVALNHDLGGYSMNLREERKSIYDNMCLFLILKAKKVKFLFA